MGCQRTMSVDAPWASSSLIDSAWPASLARCSRVCSSSTVAFTSRKCSWSQLPSTSVSPALDAAMAPWTSGGGNGATAVRRGDQGLREAKNGPVRGDAPLRHGSAPVLSAFARSGMSGGLQLHGRLRGFLLFIFKYFCGSTLRATHKRTHRERMRLAACVSTCILPMQTLLEKYYCAKSSTRV